MIWLSQSLAVGHDCPITTNGGIHKLHDKNVNIYIHLHFEQLHLLVPFICISMPGQPEFICPDSSFNRCSVWRVSDYPHPYPHPHPPHLARSVIFYSTGDILRLLTAPTPSTSPTTLCLPHSQLPNRGMPLCGKRPKHPATPLMSGNRQPRRTVSQ